MSTMSVPSPYSQRVPSTDPKEDCRDYLRTGRCKYGASCKYNHPPNVQSGGGMRAPLDPSEPLFPIRPNEPMCQYYMKHGTCKFGQTCKFHHPPQSTLQSSQGNGNAMLVGVRKSESPQVLWSSSGADANVQLLPQRPDEPNCIFFLKNGRCKYGSSCRYHHPLNHHERRAPQGEDGRRQPVQVQLPNDTGPKIHYVTSLPPGAYQQGHFVVADGNVAFLSLDGSTPTQVISVPQAKETVVYTSSAQSSSNLSLGQSRDVPSSASTASITSYDTSNSAGNVDSVPTHNDGSNALWNQQRSASGSSGMNSSFTMPDANASGRSQAGLTRVMSSGNASDKGSGGYYNPGPSLTRQHSVPQTLSGGGTTWRGRRANSFDHAALSAMDRHGQDPRIQNQRAAHEGQRSPGVRGRPPPGGRPRRRQQNVEVDDGLSMMTSALLTMLDTPEEAAGEHYGEFEQEELPMPSSQVPTAKTRPDAPPLKSVHDSPNTPGDSRLYQPAQHQQYYDQGAADDRMYGAMPGPQPLVDQNYLSGHGPENGYDDPNGAPQGWMQGWQGQGQVGPGLQDNSYVMQAQPSATPPPGTSNVGLYLS